MNTSTCEIKDCINKKYISKGGINKLNLGCGNNILENYINIDMINLEGVDLVTTLEDSKLPFEDNSIDEIVCDHILEHIYNFVPLMEELYRICKNKALIYVNVPYYKYEGAFRDPTHRRFFTERTFDYFSPENKYNYYTHARFKIIKCRLTRNHKIKRFRIEDYFIKILPFKRFFNFFFNNIFTEINFELEVIKK